jgi:hypothetical protein
VGGPEGRRPFVIYNWRCDDNIKIDLVRCGRGRGLIWLRIWASGGSCKCGNEPSGPTKFEEFIE